MNEKPPESRAIPETREPKRKKKAVKLGEYAEQIAKAVKAGATTFDAVAKKMGLPGGAAQLQRQMTLTAEERTHLSDLGLKF